jgi:RNA polymerase sigma factor (sigma-70 family)
MSAGPTTDATMPNTPALQETRPVETLAGADAQDQELVARLRASDEEAFRALFDRYASTAKALALRIVRQTHLAEEIVQEVFLAVWRSPDGYDGARGSVRAWLMGMVHHRAVDAVRREEAHRRRADSVAAETRDDIAADHAEDVVEAIGRPEERRVVRAALDELPAEQRDVLELMYFSGLTQTQVAERTGLPLGTVKSRTLLGMRRMRTALGGWER